MRRLGGCEDKPDVEKPKDVRWVAKHQVLMGDKARGGRLCKVGVEVVSGEGQG